MSRETTPSDPGTPSVPYPPRACAASIPSPVGPLGVVFDEKGVLLRIAFAGREDLSTLTQADSSYPPLLNLARQLGEYFAGERQVFEGIPLHPIGTDFQRRVWALLLEIPFGTTWSYGALAERLTPKAHARPVGSANGRNPIPILIPCHRVIGADGQLTGFGGGLGRKRWLLTHEGASFVDTGGPDPQLSIF